MKLFDPDCFLNVSITALQARQISDVADGVMKEFSFVLYGEYVNGEYLNFSSEQKPNDTHALLSYAPKAMKRSQNNCCNN